MKELAGHCQIPRATDDRGGLVREHVQIGTLRGATDRLRFVGGKCVRSVDRVKRMTTNDEGVELKNFLDEAKIEQERRTFFAVALMNPAFHLFFTQGQQALEAELYIPGVSSILNGFEASLRVTMAQLDPNYDGDLRLSPYHLLSNTMLSKAHDVGLPVERLALRSDKHFLDQIKTKDNVGIVQLRHDVCHGNILDFIWKMEFEQIQILTPECLRATAADLLDVAYHWATGLAEFREKRGRRPEGSAIPQIPTNPLGHWLQPRD